jgi:outer membrane protein assembly factor BamE (lipoprotein component of BamABCDE complex)
MMSVRRGRGVVAAGVVGLLLTIGTGCGSSSQSKTPAEEPAAAPVPAPAPPPSLREAGAQIADETSLKQLVPGKTTKAEVRERFGIPQEVVLSSGAETFIYFRDRTSGLFTRTTQRIEMLTVRFDGQGLLKDFEYRFAGK